MPFPEAKNRVVYAKNPLKQVICQLRFPPILKIDSETPAAFQELIRSEFPLYNIKKEFQAELLSFNQLPNKSQNKNHEFSSEDKIWKINLTRTFLSVSTTKYTKWEEFYKKFMPAFGALKDVYKPPFFTRNGLRYVDIIDRQELGLSDCDWSDLLKPHAIGLFATDIKQNIQHFENIHELTLSDTMSKVRMVNSLTVNAATSEKCFSIDSDFYHPQKCKIEDVKKQLDYLHSRSTNLIHWVITPKLHDAMIPTPL